AEGWLRGRDRDFTRGVGGGVEVCICILREGVRDRVITVRDAQACGGKILGEVAAVVHHGALGDAVERDRDGRSHGIRGAVADVHPWGYGPPWARGRPSVTGGEP